MDIKVAVVTGAGSGIGRAAAVAMLADGYGVALAGRRPGALQETADMATAGTPVVVPTDVTDPNSVTELFRCVAGTFGRIDTLFNNAGRGAPKANFGDIDYADWEKAVAVNLNGMFLCAQGAYRMMRDQSPRGGRIINNGSLAAHSPRPGSAAYATTKHAVTGLTRAIGLDGRDLDIVSCQIDIGNARTAMAARMAKGVMQADGRMAVEPTIDLENIGRTILLMSNMDLSANIQFVTIMASKMPFLGRG